MKLVRRVLPILLAAATSLAAEPLLERVEPLGDGGLAADSLDNTVVAIDDAAEEVWIGTLKNFGYSADDGDTWEAFGIDDGLPAPAANIGTLRLADNGDVYAGCFYVQDSPFDPLTGAGLARSRDDGASWEVFGYGEGLTNAAVWDTESDGETIYAACWSGGVNISRDDGASWEAVVPSQLTYGDNIFALALSEEFLFAGTGAGLAISTDEGESWEVSQPPYVTIQGNTYTTSAVVGFVEIQERTDGDWVWVGTVADSAGGWFGLWLVRDLGSGWQWTAIPAETNPGIYSNYIYWLEPGADNHLWMATGTGLSHRSPSGAWETITGRGLYTNQLYSVSTVDNQTIWVGTDLGLQVSFDGAQSFEIIDFQPRSGFIDEPIAYAFPNPFSPLTDGGCTIRFSVSGDPLQHDAVVDLDIYDLEGRHVVNLLDGEVRQGGFEYQLDVWDGTDAAGRQVANGLYYYVIQADGERAFVGKIAVVE